MADIINLRRARKGIERAHRQVIAAENRVRFGRSLADRTAGDAEASRAAHVLDGHKIASSAGGAKDEPSRQDD